MCYLSAAADSERSGLSADFHWQCWGLSCSGLAVRPRWHISSAALSFCILYFIFFISTHLSCAQEHWGVTGCYASFSGHARIARMFPNLATHLPNSWLSVRSGCLINCLFFGFQLKCLQWMSATGIGPNSHWVCQRNKGKFKINASLLAERRVTLKYSFLCRWTHVHLTLVNAVGTSISISCSVKYVFILQVCHDYLTASVFLRAAYEGGFVFVLFSCSYLILNCLDAGV